MANSINGFRKRWREVFFSPECGEKAGWMQRFAQQMARKILQVTWHKVAKDLTTSRSVGEAKMAKDGRARKRNKVFHSTPRHLSMCCAISWEE